MIRGGSTLLGILTCRPFINELDTKKDLWKLRVFGVVTIIYSTFASRMFLLMFSFSAKLLLFGFKVWNKRFKSFLRSSQLCKNK
jgi:hypothetical protein